MPVLDTLMVYYSYLDAVFPPTQERSVNGRCKIRHWISYFEVGNSKAIFPLAQDSIMLLLF